MAADPHELVDHGPTPDDRPVLHRDVAGELDDVREDDVIAKVAVVRDVRVRHQQAAPSHPRGGPRLCGEIERGVFADLGAVADVEIRSLARILEVLGRRAEHRAVVQPAALADPGPPGDERMASDSSAIADRDVGPDHGAGTDLDAIAEMRGGVHERRGVNARAHAGRRSTTIARSSASATSCPSTVASPFILAVAPRNLTSVRWKWIWSPGVTGRRNRAPSMPMKYMSLPEGLSMEWS